MKSNLTHGVNVKNIFLLTIIAFSILFAGCATQTPEEAVQQLIVRGDQNQRMGRFDFAMENFLEAANLAPSNSDLWGRAAFSASMCGMYDQAIQYSKKVIELTPNDSRPYHIIASAYKNLKNYDEAAINGKKALELNPMSYQVAAELADVYYLKGELNECGRYMEKFNSILAKTRTELLTERAKQTIENVTTKFATCRNSSTQ